MLNNRGEIHTAAEKIFNAKKSWQPFKQSAYEVHDFENIKEAINLLKTIPEDEQTQEDCLLLLKYYSAAGYLQIQNRFLSREEFSVALRYRQKALEIQLKLLNKKWMVDYQKTGELCYQVAIAFFETSQFNEAEEHINKAFFFNLRPLLLFKQDYMNLVDYHELAILIYIQKKDFFQILDHYNSVTLRIRQIIQIEVPHITDEKLNSLLAENIRIEHLQFQLKKIFRENPDAIFNLANDFFTLQTKMRDLTLENRKLSKTNTANTDKKEVGTNGVSVTEFSLIGAVEALQNYKLSSAILQENVNRGGKKM